MILYIRIFFVYFCFIPDRYDTTGHITQMIRGEAVEKWNEWILSDIITEGCMHSTGWGEQSCDVILSGCNGYTIMLWEMRDERENWNWFCAFGPLSLTWCSLSGSNMPWSKGTWPHNLLSWTIPSNFNLPSLLVW